MGFCNQLKSKDEPKKPSGGQAFRRHCQLPYVNFYGLLFFGCRFDNHDFLTEDYKKWAIENGHGWCKATPSGSRRSAAKSKRVSWHKEQCRLAPSPSPSCSFLKGFSTERARLGSFRGFGTERARLGTFRGLGTERARLGAFRGLGTERARLGPLTVWQFSKKSEKCHFFTQKEHPALQKLKFCMKN